MVTLRCGVAERCHVALDDRHGLPGALDKGPFPEQGPEGQDFRLLSPVRSPTHPLGDSGEASHPELLLPVNR